MSSPASPAMASAETGGSPQVLRQYALLADGERGAVLGPHGDVAFLCAPRWHDAPVFGALVGGPGRYAVTPRDHRHVWGGAYEPSTLIWRSRWVTTDATIECREALAFPGDPARAVLLRRLQAVNGQARVRVELECRAGRDDAPMVVEGHHDRVWEGRCGGLRWRWTAPPRARWEGGRLCADVDLAEGETLDLVLELSGDCLAGEVVAAEPAWRTTEEAWRRSVPRLDASLAPGESRHSYAVLRGMVSKSGAMVAAATTSLPERAQAGRNYDYRYAWIRDQCFMGQAAAIVGGDDLVEAAVDFVSARLLADGERLRPAYTLDGDSVPPQETHDLPGYPGAAGVRVGNHVRDQFQLDAFGEALLLLSAADRAGGLDRHAVRAAGVAAEAIGRRWREPDAGIWELPPARWAHSRLICAAGLRAASRRPGLDRAGDWERLADRIVDDVDADCLHPSGRWQRAPDDPRLDAALLLPAIRGAVPADDPRTVATWRAVARELGDDGYVYRFRHGDQPLHEAEGAFLLCGFHLALASHQQGDRSQALRLFERNRSAVGPPGLFTEEFDVVQRQLRGNLPQAFVHALLLETAHTLAGPDDPGMAFSPDGDQRPDEHPGQPSGQGPGQHTEQNQDASTEGSSPPAPEEAP